MKFLSVGHLKSPVGRVCLGLADENDGPQNSCSGHLRETRGHAVGEICNRTVGGLWEVQGAYYSAVDRGPIADRTVKPGGSAFSPHAWFVMQLLLTWAALVGCQGEPQLRLIDSMMVNDSPKPVCVRTGVACHWLIRQEFILAKMSYKLPLPLLVASIVWTNPSCAEGFSLTQTLLCPKTQRTEATLYRTRPKRTWTGCGWWLPSAGYFAEECSRTSAVGLGEYGTAETYFWQEMPAEAEVWVG